MIFSFSIILLRGFVLLCFQLGFSKEQEVKGAVEYDKRYVHEFF